ncbi:hypothetical protein XENORESO_009600 [Xenotaenia resolanae]|uniref:Uncharacterized protein n=1 Tax=Xenotaenia resolanae TaxID=208358 RepID=A0ABV0WLE3_9TELE
MIVLTEPVTISHGPVLVPLQLSPCVFYRVWVDFVSAEPFSSWPYDLDHCSLRDQIMTSFHLPGRGQQIIFLNVHVNQVHNAFRTETGPQHHRSSIVLNSGLMEFLFHIFIDRNNFFLATPQQLAGV